PNAGTFSKGLLGLISGPEIYLTDFLKAAFAGKNAFYAGKSRQKAKIRTPVYPIRIYDTLEALKFTSR
ncbi:MAG: hypothetical protein ACLPPF_11520, partial [Rhodomicrobium sp.]